MPISMTEFQLLSTGALTMDPAGDIDR